jgi:hypothetical protein
MTITKIRKALSDQFDGTDVKLLRKVFQKMETRSSGISTERFRADNWRNIARVNRLERLGLERHQDNKTHRQIYRLSLLALVLVNDRRSNRYLKIMRLLLRVTRAAYFKDLSKPIPVSDLITAANQYDPEDVLESLDYLKDASGFSGGGLEFPRGADSVLLPQETLMDYRSLENVLERLQSYLPNLDATAHHVGFGISALAGDDQISLLAIASEELTENWMASLPTKYHPLMGEIEAGLKAGQLALPCYGLRTLVEMVCDDKVGQRKNFKESVKALVEAGGLARMEGVQVSALYKYGSRLVHSGEIPTADEVRSASVVVVNLLKRLYHMQPAAERLTNRGIQVQAIVNGETKEPDIEESKSDS